MSVERFPSLRRPLVAFVDGLRQHFGAQLLEVRLFGSYARGEATPSSDVDLSVVLAGKATLSDRIWPMELAGDLSLEHGIALSPLVLFQAERDALRERNELLSLNLDKEGFVLS